MFGEAYGVAAAHAPGDDLFKPLERPATNKQDVACVNLDEVLVWVLAARLGRHVRHRSLDDLEERLLHALARYIAGDGVVVAFAGDLVYLVYVDDPLLGPLYIEVGGLQKAKEDVLYVLAH